MKVKIELTQEELESSYRNESLATAKHLFSHHLKRDMKIMYAAKEIEIEIEVKK